jgi:ABC-type glutathione transport system ATPase component
VIRLLADNFLVLEGGKVVEKGNADLIIHHPTHPITRKIFASQATLSQKRSPL